MTNAELIKALRWCPKRGCSKCVALLDNGSCKYGGAIKIFDAAADALEADKKRIEELEAQDSVEMHKKQVVRIAELEAQLPKEGEWIESNTRPRSAQFYCSVCHRTCYDIQPTRNKAWTKRCRYRYCPNCGARMKKGEQE